MAQIPCPHCGQPIDLPPTSAHVRNREALRTAEVVPREDYVADPARTYRTSEFDRRVKLAYYYRNREAILARARERRRARGAKPNRAGQPLDDAVKPLA